MTMEKLQRELPWYKKWFDENYLLLYRHRDVEDAREQVSLIIDSLKPAKGSSILDLGCGEGRYTVFFKDRGYRVLGLDLSEKLINCGKKKYPRLNLVKGDMRAIPGRFDLILSLFTSFGYFEDDNENQQVVCSVYRSLNPGGVFWLDFLNPQYIKNNLVAESFTRISPRIMVQEKRKIKDGRIIKDIFFEEKGLKKHYRESVRLYTRRELEEILERSGFRLAGCFGSYRGEEWHQDSERTIVYGRKEEGGGGR